MDQSNLRLFSNVYPWKGRWRDGDQEFLAKIWDDKALMVLKVAERKKEVHLSPYQEELYRCTIQCPHLPEGERPWGWVDAGEVACLCRKATCSRFRECRAARGGISRREKEVWEGGNQEGLCEFSKTWEKNKMAVPERRDTGAVDLIVVFGGGEYDPVNVRQERPFDPKIAAGYPDDEEYE